MANFWQAIIDKVTGHTDDDKPSAPKPVPSNLYNPAASSTTPPASAAPATPPVHTVTPLDISHVAASAAASSDPKVEAAKQAAAKAEADKLMAEAHDGASRQMAEAALAAQQKRDADAAAAAKAVADAADQFEVIKEHTLTYDDTLSALALHFYGHATPEYWGLIILANKNTIGDKVKDYTPGKVIKIPKLPDSMKK